ncbi:MAG: helix-turn-helix domain-containing protein [Verrucomicrobiota bacterium JB022]|nr:helix-turn-helix domain-containing protein [Verrucomicrobiota bacterium JB022]
MSLQFPPITDDASPCPIRNVLDCVGDKWSVLALAGMSSGTIRFSDLRRAIGDISPRMLAKTLRTLERDGYVSREAFPTVPPRVDYKLTGLGESLVGVLTPLVEWADTHYPEVRKARAAYVPPPSPEAL